MSAASDTPEDVLVGTLLADRYRVLRRLGEGGMGVVYLAEHVLLEKRFALKVLAERRWARTGLVDQFMKEARTAARLRHPNIVDITDFGTTPDGTAFLAMELLEGRSLGDAIWQAGRLEIPRTLALMEQLCAGVAFAHAHDTIHRDLKPDNVFLVEEAGAERVKILDFGLAAIRRSDEKRHSSSELVGTAHYMAPEQIQGEPPDRSFDVYATGCILYEMLTGRPPFDAASPTAVLMKHLTEAVVPPSQAVPEAGISPALEAVVLKALARDRAERFQSVEELAAALAPLRGAAAVAGAPPVDERGPTAPTPVVAAVPAGGVALSEVAPAPELDPSPAASLPSAPPPSRRGRGALLAGIALLGVVAVVAAIAWFAGADRRAFAADLEHIGHSLSAPDEARALLDKAAQRWGARPELDALRPRIASALHERGRAEAAALHYPAAVRDLEAAAALAPTDGAIPAELARARAGAFATEAGMLPSGDGFVDAFEYPNRRGAAPMTRVDYAAAAELCKGAQKRLCTEDEWQRACTAATLGFNGHVAEWTSTPFRTGQPQMVVRGGTANGKNGRTSCAARDYFLPGIGGAPSLGFRCCVGP